MTTEWMTTKEAAELSGYHPDYVRKLMESGKVKAQKFGQTWMVNRQSFTAYLKKIEEMGAKRGPKTE